MILPDLKSVSLISIGQSCNDNCNVLLSKKNTYAIKQNEIILEGTRNHFDGLWDILVTKKKIIPDN